MSLFLKQNAECDLTNAQNREARGQLKFAPQAVGEHVNYRMYEDLIAMRRDFAPQLDRLNRAANADAPAAPAALTADEQAA